jgi:hypothetical protein
LIARTSFTDGGGADAERSLGRLGKLLKQASKQLHDATFVSIPVSPAKDGPRVQFTDRVEELDERVPFALPRVREIRVGFVSAQVRLRSQELAQRPEGRSCSHGSDVQRVVGQDLLDLIGRDLDAAQGENEEQEVFRCSVFVFGEQMDPVSSDVLPKNFIEKRDF